MDLPSPRGLSGSYAPSPRLLPGVRTPAYLDVTRFRTEESEDEDGGVAKPEEQGELQAAVARMEGELAGLRFQLESARSDTRYDEVQTEAQHLQRVLHDLRQAQELAQAQAREERERAKKGSRGGTASPTKYL